MLASLIFVTIMLLGIAAAGTLAGAAIGSILAAFCVFIVASLLAWLAAFFLRDRVPHGR